ncbi:hypothetical protein EJB05_00092 [Eragrostis curvula]|uniref:Uncharacterized protein n=1 Tax=Eragrostis curvula TaxID=38414 RepID=A0A5J9WLM2_9POAL|nr:hypothetical protein EJB05_00092 [Eragrostis curvula]
MNDVSSINSSRITCSNYCMLAIIYIQSKISLDALDATHQTLANSEISMRFAFCVSSLLLCGNTLNSDVLEETKTSRCVLLACFRLFIVLTPLPEHNERILNHRYIGQLMHIGMQLSVSQLVMFEIGSTP